MLKAVRDNNADYGVAVVMDVKTGAIRAMANLGRTKKGNIWETYNHAVGSSTEPGSTFKLASIMALLEDGKIDLKDSVDLEQGNTKFFDQPMTDASRHGIDSTSIRRAFEISSNVGICRSSKSLSKSSCRRVANNKSNSLICSIYNLNSLIPL